jgi:uncharacterized protein (DUF2267 family)
MEMQHFTQTVQKYAGSSDELAERASESTLEVLGALVTKSDQRALARQLPSPLSEAIQRSSPDQTFDLETFYDRIEVGESVEGALQLEHAQAVCQALAQTVDSEMRTRLARHLPEEYEHLFEPRKVPAAKPRRHRDVAEDTRKLSSGRPGSSKPLSEASSGAAHSNSVAESSNPRGDRKLSTGHGSPHEGRDLATGRPDGQVVPPEEREESADTSEE